MESLRTVLDLFRRRDVIGWMLAFSAFGALVGAFALPTDWSLLGRIGGGLFMGFNGALYVVGPRMVGGDDFDG